MRRLVVFCLVWGFATAAIAFTGISSAVDPMILPEPLPTTSTPSYYNPSGRTQVTSAITGLGSTTAIIVTLGQSLSTSAASGTYTTVNANAHNLNVGDGGIYQCKNPVLGTTWAPAQSPNGNSPTCQVADGLITAGTFTRVIMVPIGIAGTTAAAWQPGGTVGGNAYNDRIKVAMRRLRAIGVTSPTYILWHQGEGDAGQNTPPAQYTASVQAVAQTFKDEGSTAPFFVALETLQNNVTSSSIRGAQAAAVSVPLHIVAGADWDTLTGGTNRQDGTHLTATGAINAANLDVAIIQACKLAAC